MALWGPIIVSVAVMTRVGVMSHMTSMFVYVTWVNGSGVQHPNIIRLCKAFVQHGALFFVHEYHPLAQSVYQR